jgi:hypothetical protein
MPADQTVPLARALVAARKWAHEHGHAQPDDRMLSIIWRAGVTAGEARDGGAYEWAVRLKSSRGGEWVLPRDDEAHARQFVAENPDATVVRRWISDWGPSIRTTPMRDADARAAYNDRLGQRANDYLRRQHKEAAMPEPYTEDNEEPLEQIADDAYTKSFDLGASHEDAMDVAVKALLAALTERGLLFPEGVDRRTEWGVRLVWDDGRPDDVFTAADHADAVGRFRYHNRMRQHGNWLVTPHIVRRTVVQHATAWSPIPPEPKESADG